MKTDGTHSIPVGSRSRAAQRIDGHQPHLLPAPQPTGPSKHRASRQPRWLAIAARRRRRRAARQTQRGTR